MGDGRGSIDALRITGHFRCPLPVACLIPIKVSGSVRLCNACFTPPIRHSLKELPEGELREILD